MGRQGGTPSSADAWGLHPPWRGSTAGATAARREAQRCQGAGRGSPALREPLGWVPVPPAPGWGQPALPTLAGTGRQWGCWCLAGYGRMPLLLRAWLPRSSLRSRENFGLDWVPSLLLSCGHHLQRRAICPGVRGCPLSLHPPAGTAPPPRGPAGPLPFLPLIFQPALLLGARLHFQGQLH